MEVNCVITRRALEELARKQKLTLGNAEKDYLLDLVLRSITQQTSELVKMDKITINDYTYVLPPELIAQHAHHPRDECRLLVLKEGKIEHRIFKDIVEYLQEGDVLVVNETKVQHAKLLGKKTTGGRVEALLTRKIDELTYEACLKGRHFTPGTIVEFDSNKAEILEMHEKFCVVKFAKPPQDMLLPLPPYITAAVPEGDYQTIFARTLGSLAAPTAGLHFTEELLETVKKKGVKLAKIRLDISHETFLPVRDIDHHSTGKEYFNVTEENAHAINTAKRIIAVGTTVVKCLESCERKNGTILPTTGYSEMFIKPGYQFKTNIAAMITNFHLPKSSLLLLVSAYMGWDRLKPAYEEAVEKRYRFFSLGDGMMIMKEKA